MISAINKFLTASVLLAFSTVTIAQAHLNSSSLWGRTGHYITGEIAQLYLTDKTTEHVQRLLGETSLADATIWMDQVRSTQEYGHTRDWHWVTIPDGKTYEEAEKNPNGDVVEALERHIEKLKAGGLSEDDERDSLRFVIHMIGDMHQPLHVGSGEDRGGNDVRVRWLDRNSNLHRVWDTDMIESWQITTLQWVDALNIITDETITDWQSTGVRDWAMESVYYRPYIYDLPDDNNLGWEYRNRNFHIMEKRLMQAGIRIAGVLNAIYDPQD